MRFAVLVKDAEVADQAVEVGVESGCGDDHLRRDGCAVTEDHPAGIDCRHRCHHLDAAGPHRVDKLIGQGGNAAALLYRRLQSERRPVESVDRKITEQ